MKAHHNQRHGHAVPGRRSGDYRSWEAMKSRCDNPKDPFFIRYGARGISYPIEWRDFAIFHSDMGARPCGTSLDRIDNNSDYSKENCRWATPGQQANNRSGLTNVEYMGEKMTITNLSKMTGVPRARLYERISRKGWDVERALNEPVRVRGKR